MNLEKYKQQRKAYLLAQPSYRNLCQQCLQPSFSCYCSLIIKFDPKIKFVILIHPIERRRRIATGRMAHLCLENSELIIGEDYTSAFRVNEILNDPQYQPFVLYPGRSSLNLTDASIGEKSAIFIADKTPVVFVIDGTWNTARKTMRLSQNLNQLPRLCFTPPYQSRFRLRKQPRSECVSTIEAIHHFIDLLNVDVPHKNLIDTFDQMVAKQIELRGETHRKRCRNKIKWSLKAPFY